MTCRPLEINVGRAVDSKPALSCQQALLPTRHTQRLEALDRLVEVVFTLVRVGAGLWLPHSDDRQLS